jgi:hypothetical protein
MTYSTADEVRAITETTLTDEALVTNIKFADKRIRAKLISARIGAPADDGNINDNISLASAYLAASIVVKRGGLSGEYPESEGTGTSKVTTKAHTISIEYENTGFGYLDDFISAIKLTSSSSGIEGLYRIVGASGERAGTYRAMTPSEELEN